MSSRPDTPDPHRMAVLSGTPEQVQDAVAAARTSYLEVCAGRRLDAMLTCPGSQLAILRVTRLGDVEHHVVHGSEAIETLLAS